VSSFALDKYDVTVGRFRTFVAAYENGWRPTVGSGANPHVTVGDTSWRAGWDDSQGNGTNLPKPGAFTDTLHLACSSIYQTWTPEIGANENKAINCVNWYEAFAFCIWDGGRLATESEWEYAAAGGSDNRLYPWGSAPPDCSYANFYHGNFCSGGQGSVAAVGATPKGAGRWGHADLMGNVWEWIFDWYADYAATATHDSAESSAGGVRVIRGAGFYGFAPNMLSAHRNHEAPDALDYFVGVRCARSPQ